MDKSPDAFRTISEVSEVLATPAHVLRFWESRFPQIKPVKRAGGRRYYRPSDIALLTGIKRLLHDEGLTIRGVQKILRDHGVRHVSGLTDDALTLADDLDDRFKTEVRDTSDPGAPAENAVLPEEPVAAIVSVPPPVAAPASGDPQRKFQFDVPRNFASQIRALWPHSLQSRRSDIAAVANRLTQLRARLADRIDAGKG